MELNTINQGDVREVLKTLPDKSIHCCVTSPPYYGLRIWHSLIWGEEECNHIRDLKKLNKAGKYNALTIKKTRLKNGI